MISYEDEDGPPMTAGLGGTTVTVTFMENGSEYVGTFAASGVHRVAYYPSQPCVIRINGARIEMDEPITGIHVLGEGRQSVAEGWTWTEAGGESPEALRAVLGDAIQRVDGTLSPEGGAPRPPTGDDYNALWAAVAAIAGVEP